MTYSIIKYEQWFKIEEASIENSTCFLNNLHSNVVIVAKFVSSGSKDLYDIIKSETFIPLPCLFGLGIAFTSCSWNSKSVPIQPSL